MSKAFFFLVLGLSLPLFSQFCQYPIALSQDVRYLQVPSEYLYGGSGRRVVGFTAKVSGLSPLRVLGDDLQQPSLSRYLMRACPEGCFYYITAIASKENSCEVIYGENTLIYMQWHKAE
jgi:hypothetical protein